LTGGTQPRAQVLAGAKQTRQVRLGATEHDAATEGTARSLLPPFATQSGNDPIASSE
jgi:hypothetical protein